MLMRRSSPTMFRTTNTAAVAVDDVDVKEEIATSFATDGKMIRKTNESASFVHPDRICHSFFHNESR